jgi:predicted amidophosphoribosyltransferase
LTDAAPIIGKHLALIDDVLTTGSTAQALAELLIKAGARSVDVYCLARTPKPGD